MALSIGVSIGTKITIGNAILLVKDLIKQEAAMLQLNNRPPFMVTGDERTEIMPDVFVQVGLKNVQKRRFQETSAFRLAFEAPMSVKISRVR